MYRHKEMESLNETIMKTAIIKLSDVLKHPKLRMDAEYHIGKKNGENAFTHEGGKLVPNDDSGKIMLTDEQAKMYNDTSEEIKNLKEGISEITKKIK